MCIRIWIQRKKKNLVCVTALWWFWSIIAVAGKCCPGVELGLERQLPGAMRIAGPAAFYSRPCFSFKCTTRTLGCHLLARIMREESMLVRPKKTFSCQWRCTCKITLTVIGWSLNEFKFSTGHAPTHFSKPAWEDAVGLPQCDICTPLLHGMTSGYIRMNLLHFNSYLFTLVCNRKNAVRVWSPRLQGRYCKDQETALPYTAAFFAAMGHLCSSADGAEPRGGGRMTWITSGSATCLWYDLWLLTSLSLGFPDLLGWQWRLLRVMWASCDMVYICQVSVTD